MYLLFGGYCDCVVLIVIGCYLCEFKVLDYVYYFVVFFVVVLRKRILKVV